LRHGAEGEGEEYITPHKRGAGIGIVEPGSDIGNAESIAGRS